MRWINITLAAVGVALSLSACNTTDALIPQVDVGSTQSSPITHAEASAMAASPDAGMASTYPAAQNAWQQPAYPPPQNTLQAQAQGLASGAQGHPPANGPGTPPQTLDQQAAQLQQGQMAPQQQEPAPQVAALPPASASTGDTIRFLPIIGAPVQAVTPLSRQLGAEARAQGLTIRASGDTSTEHILKGYFSAFADSGNVTVVYVWDVLDNAGGRLHRIQGQEKIASRASDPWSAVDAATMQQIATKTISGYVQWRQLQPG